MIAIDRNTGLVYEGESFHGYGIWPSPFFSLATVIWEERDFAQVPGSEDLSHARLIFREDSFDPVTRIRRGRIYANPGSTPQMWRVHPHAFLPSQQLTTMHLHGFVRWPAQANLMPTAKVVLALGTKEAMTLWRVVGLERISTGEDLVTLKSRTAFGILPDLKGDMAEGAPGLKTALERVADAAYRLGPESLIDRCRDAAQVLLGSWLAVALVDDSLRTLDLGHLLKRMEANEELRNRQLMIGASRIVARLHARAKPNEQAARTLKPVSEDDAECSMVNLALLMRETGWFGG